jgi:hypothetical protein
MKVVIPGGQVRWRYAAGRPKAYQETNHLERRVTRPVAGQPLRVRHAEGCQAVLLSARRRNLRSDVLNFHLRGIRPAGAGRVRQAEHGSGGTRGVWQVGGGSPRDGWRRMAVVEGAPIVQCVSRQASRAMQNDRLRAAGTGAALHQRLRRRRASRVCSPGGCAPANPSGSSRGHQHAACTIVRPPAAGTPGSWPRAHLDRGGVDASEAPLLLEQEVFWGRRQVLEGGG